MRRVTLLLPLLLITLNGCNKTEDGEFDAAIANEKLTFLTDGAGNKYPVMWKGQFEAYNPETLWECDFSVDFIMNISETHESGKGIIKQLESQTPYTLESGKIIIEGRSFHYNYWFDADGILHIKSTKSTAIERICRPVVAGEPL